MSYRYIEQGYLQHCQLENLLACFLLSTSGALFARGGFLEAAAHLAKPLFSLSFLGRAPHVRLSSSSLPISLPSSS